MKGWYPHLLLGVCFVSCVAGSWFKRLENDHVQQRDEKRERIAGRCEIYCARSVPLLMRDPLAVAWEPRIVEGRTGRDECICALGAPQNYIEQDLEP